MTISGVKFCGAVLGAYLRFSVTYVALTETDEDALMEATKRQHFQNLRKATLENECGHS